MRAVVLDAPGPSATAGPQPRRRLGTDRRQSRQTRRRHSAAPLPEKRPFESDEAL